MTSPERSRIGRTGRVSVRLGLPMVAQARAAGLGEGVLLEAAGLQGLDLADPDARMSHADWVALLELGAELTDDPRFGLHAAEHLAPENDSVVLLLIRSQPSVVDALARIEQSYRLAHDSLTMNLEIEGRSARCWITFAPGLAYPPMLAEYQLASWAVLGRQVLGDQARPTLCRFKHPAPTETGEFDRVLGCPSEFGTERNEMTFPASTLEAPFQTANPLLGDILFQELKRLEDRLIDDSDLVRRCTRWITTEIHAGRDANLDGLAAELRVGRRTLRRRLEAEGTTHRALVDDVRRELAMSHVEEGKLSLDEISFLLGFSETSAFRRAFKRWTGHTPSQHRRALATTTPRRGHRH